MLTAILSTDYIDVTGDGPSDDDLGTYTKINYTKTHDDYAWKTPYDRDNKIASYNPGLASNTGKNGDAKGSFVAGKKEIWNVHSIVTKNQVAVFKLLDRTDAEESSNGNKHLKKLDRIILYSKPDLIKNGTSGATPLKTVVFNYDYSLCPGILNSSTGEGKLTLKSLYFLNENSKKGNYINYQFYYAESAPGVMSYNYPYDGKAYDRWANYTDKNDLPGNLEIAHFPYTNQNYDNTNGYAADDFAKAWNLNRIKLPSNGIIDITYEADDYAFVQHKKAMQMTKITALLKSSEVTGTDQQIITLAESRKNQHELSICA